MHHSLSHTRTQASLGLKVHSGANLLAANSRQGHKPSETSFKLSRDTMGQKRGSETTDLEKKGSFAKQNRMSHQISSSNGLNSSTTISSGRLVTHKASVPDAKKPALLSAYPPSSHHQ